MDQNQVCADNCRRINELEKTVATETAKNAAEHKACNRRIDDLEEASKQQNGILITLQKQADAIETMNTKIDGMCTAVGDISNRIDIIEKEPADKWKKISFEIIKYVVIAAVGVAVGVILKV